MECTQPVECTQQYDTYTERTCAEQIGFLGICGTKHPIKKGPNKIGRDPQTCNIVLDDNSISRQHAVINILSKNNFMVMDLGSSNKTKLWCKTLEPYISYPLKNGDTVQFGQVFGLFRTLDDDDDLPMTQMVEIPETPVNIRHMSRIKTAPITTIPESPDVSDKDDSFRIQHNKKIEIKSQNNNSIKLSNKIMGHSHGRVNEIDKVYLNSSTKSTTLVLPSQGSSNQTAKNEYLSTNKSFIDDKDLFDLETQALVSLEDIESSVSIYEANTQVPCVPVTVSRSQISDIKDLPQVCKVQDQNNVQLNLYSSNDRNCTTSDKVKPATLQDKQDILSDKCSKSTSNENEKSSHETVGPITNNKLNTSDEEICFEDIDSQPCEEWGSQPLLPPDLPDDPDLVPLNVYHHKQQKSNIKDTHSITTVAPEVQDVTKTARQKDEDNSNYLVSTKPVTNKNQSDDDLTDCEDDLCNLKNNAGDDDVTDCEDDIIEISQNKVRINSSCHDLNNVEDTDDVPTQVIEELKSVHEESKCKTDNDNIPFEDMLTQVIEEHPTDTNHKIDDSTRLNDGNDQPPRCKSPVIECYNTFKVPLFSPKFKKKDIKQTSPTIVSPKSTRNVHMKPDDDNYYDETQQIFHDLCSQKEPLNTSDQIKKGKTSSLERNMLIREKSSDDSDVGSDEKIKLLVSNLSKEEIRQVIGVGLSPDKSSCKFVSFRKNETDSSAINAEQQDKMNKNSSRALQKKRGHSSKQSSSKKSHCNTFPSKSTSNALDGHNTTKKITGTVKDESKTANDKDSVIGTRRSSRNKRVKNETKPIKIDDIKSESLDRKEINRASASSNKNVVLINDLPIKFKEPNGPVVRRSRRHVVSKDENKDINKNDDSKYKNVNKNQPSTSTDINVFKIETSSIDSDAHRNRSNANKDKKAHKCEKSPFEHSSRHRTKKSQKPKEDKNEINKSDVVVTNTPKGNKMDESNEQDQSTVYSSSSDKSIVSLRNLKRQASSDILPLKSKRAKSSTTGSSTRAPSGRGVRTQYVLFTAFPMEAVQDKLQKLGAVIVKDVKECTVVLTLKIKRTFKMLCAFGLGKPIVGPNWVQACVDTNMVVDPWRYLMEDEASEKRFHFNLRHSLTCKRNFLRGYNITSTPNVTPNAQEMKTIVECSGGRWGEGGGKWLCVSCLADRPLWPQLKRRGAVMVSTEFILGGILQQKLTTDRDKISNFY